MEYRAVYVTTGGGDVASNLEFVINEWAGDGYIPHTITPKVEEGNTVGYIVLFDATNAER